MEYSSQILDEIDSGEIHLLLQRIISSPEFSKKPQLNKFLGYIVNETLAGRESGIKQYTIAVNAFGRGGDFNAQADPIVRIEARRLRRTLDRYYNETGKNDTLVLTIPVGSYIPVFTKRNAQTEVKSLREMEFHKDPGSATKLPRVAVFPFTNLTPHEIDTYIIDGLCEEISSNLSRFQELTTIAYFSMKQLLDKEINMEEAAQQFEISYLVTGSLRVSAEFTQVVVSLIHFPTKEQLWSQTYKREINDENIFNVLDEIAEQSITVIGSGQGIILRNIAKASKHPQPKSLTVLDAISKYYEAQWNFDAETFQSLPATLKEATELDPDNALIWAVLGEVYTDFHSHQNPLIENPLDLAEKCITKALNLDPLCQHAHHVRAYIAMHRGDLETVIEACNKVVELNPNNSYLTGLSGFWLALVGEFDLGESILKRAMDQNPYYPPYFHHAFFLDHYQQGDFAAALVEAERFNMPDYYWDPLDKAIALSALDRLEEAKHQLAELYEMTPHFAADQDEFMSAFIKDTQLRKDMLANLSKAGLILNRS